MAFVDYIRYADERMAALQELSFDQFQEEMHPILSSFAEEFGVECLDLDDCSENLVDDRSHIVVAALRWQRWTETREPLFLPLFIIGDWTENYRARKGSVMIKAFMPEESETRIGSMRISTDDMETWEGIEGSSDLMLKMQEKAEEITGAVDWLDYQEFSACMCDLYDEVLFEYIG